MITLFCCTRALDCNPYEICFVAPGAEKAFGSILSKGSHGSERYWYADSMNVHSIRSTEVPM